MGIFNNFAIQPDLFFYLNVLITLFSLILIYKSLVYYKKIRSVEYLLIAGIFSRYAYYFYVVIRWVYYENYTIYWINKDPLYWPAWPWVSITHIYTPLMALFILVHASHVIDISERSHSNLIKFAYRTILLIILMYLLFSIVHAIETAVTRDWSAWSEIGNSVPFKKYMYFNFIYLIFPHDSSWSAYILESLPLLLAQLFLIYAYISVKPEINNKSILYSRVCWILFGLNTIVFQIITTLQFAGLILNVAVPTIFNVQATFEFITVFFITSIIIFYPQTLLISKYQILQAKHLYKLVDSKDQSKVQTGIPFLTTNDSFVSYLNDISKDLINPEP